MNNSWNELLSFFNMQTDPFSRDIDTEHLLRLPSIVDALTGLDFFCARRGIGILSGKSGCGKSCLLRILSGTLPTGLYRPVYLCHASVSLGEFYSHIAVSFNLQPGGRRATLFRAIKDHVTQLSRTEKIHPILIIDEAHALSNSILAELRQLANFYYDSETCLSILLSGQDELLHRLRLSFLEPLANSITTTVIVKPLSQEETASYLEERLKQAGARPDIFTPPAVRAIHNIAHGIMRSVNTIASAGLVKAWRVKSNQVESEFITTTQCEIL